MKFFKLLKSKILLCELRLRYGVKTMPVFLKAALLILTAVFSVSAVTLLYHLDQKASVEVPAEGGMLVEGIIGTPRFVNPVLTISDADRDLASLIYSGLLRAEGGYLIPDLAEKYEISEDGLCYAFTLKPGILWSDNHPITTDDIVFTIEQIKSPATKSPKRASWEGVTIDQLNDREIRFCMEKPYAPFLENMTTGILPYHIWKDILSEQMTLSDFNIKAVGSGPYKIEAIDRSSAGIISSYTLVPNKNFALQKPYISEIVLKFYPSEKTLMDAYKRGEIASLSAISPKNIIEIKKGDAFLKTYLLPRIFAVFFNQNEAPVFAEKEIRAALTLATDKERIVKEVLQNFGDTIETPVPPGSIGFETTTSSTSSFEENLKEAKEILEKNGWTLNAEENVLEKKTKKKTTKLEFSISTSDITDLVQTAELLKEMWTQIGAKVNIKIYEIGDLEQNVLRPRKYDTLLFGEIMGRDPDPFAFWHSSQRNDPGLNIAMYANITADKLLESARTTFDLEEREEKYHQFQEELAKDQPAIFLYSPHFIYLLPGSIKGVEQTAITIPSERFSRVYHWYINTKRIWKNFP